MPVTLTAPLRKGTEYCDTVRPQFAIASTQGQAFEIGLSDEEAVKRIGVVKRQFRRRLRMIAGYWQQMKAVSRNRGNQLPQIALPEKRD